MIKELLCILSLVATSLIASQNDCIEEFVITGLATKTFEYHPKYWEALPITNNDGTISNFGITKDNISDNIKRKCIKSQNRTPSTVLDIKKSLNLTDKKVRPRGVYTIEGRIENNIISITSLEKNIMTTVKATQIDNMVKGYIKIVSNANDGSASTAKRKYKRNFITNITIKMNNIIVYNVYTNPSFIIRDRSVYTSGKLFFNFEKVINSDTIEVIVTNNFGKQETKIININNSKEIEEQSIQKSLTNNIDFRTLHSKAWDAMSIDDAIYRLYGNIKPVESNILTIIPFRLGTNINDYRNKLKKDNYKKHITHLGQGLEIPIHISSELDMESIAVFSEGNIRSLIAVFQNLPSQKVLYNFSINILEPGTYKFTVIGKGRDGQFYKSEQEVESSGQVGCFMSGGGSDADWQNFVYEQYKSRKDRIRY